MKYRIVEIITGIFFIIVSVILLYNIENTSPIQTILNSMPIGIGIVSICCGIFNIGREKDI